MAARVAAGQAAPNLPGAWERATSRDGHVSSLLAVGVEVGGGFGAEAAFLPPPPCAAPRASISPPLYEQVRTCRAADECLATWNL